MSGTSPEDRPGRSRGVIGLAEERCTVCMLCVRECPDWCIEIETHTETLPADETSRRPRTVAVLDRFAIDFSLCMYCGICVEVCPFDALHWSPVAEYAVPSIDGLTHERDRLGEWERTVPEPPALDPRGVGDVPGARRARPATGGPASGS